MQTIAMQWSFGPFRLDTASASLWHGTQRLPVRPKAFDVLVYLVSHAGELVLKETLLEAVWPEAVVGDAVLKVRIRELRQVLGETAQATTYIETVPRRGYRFRAPVTAMPVLESRVRAAAPALVGEVDPPPIMVGRETELAQLQQCFAHACQGQRQVVWIAGEAGIGKTTLVDAFVAQLATTAELWIGRGQCIEQYGAGEAYLPLLEALGRLGQQRDGTRLVAALRQQAPSWLLHLPALVTAEDAEALRQRGVGATRERMLRELAEAVETLTQERSLLLVLEDLHWGDASTVEWLTYVARRRDPARLLVLGTYRPMEAIVQDHPVHTATQELRRQGQGTELLLTYLTKESIATYLTYRLGEALLPHGLVDILHQRTSGNPLFLVTLVTELLRQHVLRPGIAGWALLEGLDTVMTVTPASLRQMIEWQLAQLVPAEQTLLEAASVAGAEFAVAAVAAAVDWSVDDIEERCAAFARRGQFVRVGEIEAWPDGTVTSRYGFLHALYRETLYERVPVGRRVRWHQQIGRRLEAGYDPQARERAAELAAHFVRGRDTVQAVKYLHYAGEQAGQRSAHQEALQHLTQGLTLLATLPETPARFQQELDLQIALGLAWSATKGFAAPEVEQTYARARVLCAQVGETPQLFTTLWGLCRYYHGRGALATARELGEQLWRVAERVTDPTPRLDAHDTLGYNLFYLGDYTTAWRHLAQGITLIDPVAQQALVRHRGLATGVMCLGVAANVLWCLGYPAQAMQRSQEAIALAQTLAHPYSLAAAQYWTISLHYRRREAPAVQAQAETLITLATGQGFPLYRGFGTCWRGWALALQGHGAAGLEQMRQGLAAIVATGQTLSQQIYLVLLAEAAGHTGQVEEGLRLVVEAITRLGNSGRGDMLAEAYRVQGALLLHQTVPDTARAEACFQQALTLARHQQARTWALRAAISLSRLWQCQGKRKEAHQLLAPIYDWFTEGFDTADLQEAKALLEDGTMRY